MQGLLKGAKTCKLDFCEQCVIGKQTRVKFGTSIHNTEGILDYILTDVWGPTKTASLGGKHYLVTFVDDFSRRVWVYTMKSKDEVCHARRISARPDWRIRTEVRGAILSIYYTVLGLSLTCSFSELYLYLWVYNNFCNNKNHFTYTKNYHRSGVHHNLYTYTRVPLLVLLQFYY